MVKFHYTDNFDVGIFFPCASLAAKAKCRAIKPNPVSIMSEINNK